MCHFITSFIPATANLDAVAQIAMKYKLTWIEIENAHLSKQLKAKYRYFYTTKGMCDCGTALGSANRFVSKVNNEQEDRLKLKKKGWSDTKIGRWLEQKKEHAEYLKLSNQQKNFPEIQQWMNFISEVLSMKYSKEVGVLLHSYRNSAEGEVFDLQGCREEGNISEDTFLNIQEGLVYFFKN